MMEMEKVAEWVEQGEGEVEEHQHDGIHADLLNTGLGLITSKVEIAKEVKFAMRKIIYGKALKLKERIAEEIEEMEGKLKKEVVKLEGYKAILAKHKEARMTTGVTPEMQQKFYRIREDILKTLKFVADYEEELAAQKRLWDWFRGDYRDEILKMVNKVNKHKLN